MGDRRSHLYLERCNKPQPHDAHEWIAHVISEDDQHRAIMWVEPHLCLGHERIMSLDIVDDAEQEHFTPQPAVEAASAQEGRVKIGQYEGDRGQYFDLLANAAAPLARHARREDGAGWAIAGYAALGIIGVVCIALGVAVKAGWFG